MFTSGDLENFPRFDYMYVVNSKLSSAVFTVMLMRWKALRNVNVYKCLKPDGLSPHILKNAKLSF